MYTYSHSFSPTENGVSRRKINQFQSLQVSSREFLCRFNSFWELGVEPEEKLLCLPESRVTLVCRCVWGWGEMQTRRGGDSMTRAATSCSPLDSHTGLCPTAPSSHFPSIKSWALSPLRITLGTLPPAGQWGLWFKSQHGCETGLRRTSESLVSAPSSFPLPPAQLSWAAWVAKRSWHQMEESLRRLSWLYEL